MIIRGTITKDKLSNIYKTINTIIDNPDFYYNDEEVQTMKKDKSNIFIEKY